MFDCALAVVASSVTGWLDYLFNIWPFGTMKRCPIALKSCQSWTQTLANIKWTVKNWQRLLKFCSRGKNSPNLVTLKANEGKKVFLKELFWILLSSDKTVTLKCSFCCFDAKQVLAFSVESIKKVFGRRRRLNSPSFSTNKYLGLNWNSLKLKAQKSFVEPLTKSSAKSDSYLNLLSE